MLNRNKEIKKVDNIFVYVILLVSFLAILIDQFSGHPYIHEWTIIVNEETELEATIHDVDSDHANFLFNDSIYFDVGDLQNHTKEIEEIWQMKRPFTLQKKAGSDTVIITSPHYDVKYLILE